MGGAIKLIMMKVENCIAVIIKPCTSRCKRKGKQKNERCSGDEGLSSITYLMNTICGMMLHGHRFIASNQSGVACQLGFELGFSIDCVIWFISWHILIFYSKNLILSEVFLLLHLSSRRLVQRDEGRD